MFAVFICQGHQYMVEPNQKIVVSRLKKAEGEVISFDKILLLNSANGEDPRIGVPYLTDLEVRAKVLRHFRGKKLRVFKMKAKKRYSRTIGFREDLTELLIEGIESSKRQNTVREPALEATKQEKSEVTSPKKERRAVKEKVVTKKEF